MSVWGRKTYPWQWFRLFFRGVYSWLQYCYWASAYPMLRASELTVFNVTPSWSLVGVCRELIHHRRHLNGAQSLAGNMLRIWTQLLLSLDIVSCHYSRISRSSWQWLMIDAWYINCIIHIDMKWRRERVNPYSYEAANCFMGHWRISTGK